MRKVGTIAKTGKPFELIHIKGDFDWIANPDWVKQEGEYERVGEERTRSMNVRMKKMGLKKPFNST